MEEEAEVIFPLLSKSVWGIHEKEVLCAHYSACVAFLAHYRQETYVRDRFRVRENS